MSLHFEIADHLLAYASGQGTADEQADAILSLVRVELMSDAAVEANVRAALQSSMYPRPMSISEQARIGITAALDAVTEDDDGQ